MSGNSNQVGRRRLLAGLAGVAVVGTAGCSNGGDSGNSGNESKNETTPSPESDPEPTESDESSSGPVSFSRTMATSMVSTNPPTSGHVPAISFSEEPQFGPESPHTLEYEHVDSGRRLELLPTDDAPTATLQSCNGGGMIDATGSIQEYDMELEGNVGVYQDDVTIPVQIEGDEDTFSASGVFDEYRARLLADGDVVGETDATIFGIGYPDRPRIERDGQTVRVRMDRHESVSDEWIVRSRLTVGEEPEFVEIEESVAAHDEEFVLTEDSVDPDEVTTANISLHTDTDPSWELLHSLPVP